MGIPLKVFDCRKELRNRFHDDNSDEVPELSPVIVVKIYLYFAANSFWRRRRTLTSCVETKSKGDKVVICLQGKELLEKPCRSSCSILCVLRMGLKYRDKQGEWTINFQCNKNNHALCWGWQIRLSTLDNHHCLRLRAIELASGWQSDLSPSTQGMIFILLHGCDIIRIFKLRIEERGVSPVLRKWEWCHTKSNKYEQITLSYLLSVSKYNIH